MALSVPVAPEGRLYPVDRGEQGTWGEIGVAHRGRVHEVALVRYIEGS